MTSPLLSKRHPLRRRLTLRVTEVSLTTLVLLLAACGDSKAGRPTAPEEPVPVASVRIEPLAEALLVGTTQALQASTLSATGAVLTDRPLTWESENHGVATVSAAGVITARAEGTTGIRASSEGKSSRIEVRIVAPNPVPVLTSMTPTTIAAGSPGPLLVEVTGTGFTAATRLRLDGVEQTTDHIDATTLRLKLSTAALAQAVTLAVTAATPAPGGGVSNALTLAIEDAVAPTITQLEPRQIAAGWTAAFTLTISGTGFTPRTAVWWDGAERATRYVSPTALQVTIDPQDVRVARTVAVMVQTPAPGGGTATATFAVNAIPVARVTVHSPWGLPWTWRNHALRLTATAEDHLGNELTDRRATWSVANPFVATLVPVSEREVSVYGVAAGETDVEASIDGVRAKRTVRVHDAPDFQLVYEAGEGDDRHLRLWDLTTANAPSRLRTPNVAFTPAPSPDGRLIAYAGVAKGAGPAGDVDLFILAADGGTTRLLPSAGFDGDPAWSPDGTKLAFTSNRTAGALDIFVVELATGTLYRLTDAAPQGGAPGSGSAARAPAWSPDGSQIAYTVQGRGGSQLWVMSADGSNKRQLTNRDDANDLEPTWAPDGSVIVFARVFRQPQQSMVMTVKPDGSDESNIGGRLVSIAATPAYSPDGRWLTTAQTRGSEAGAVYAFSLAANAGPRIVMPESLGGGRHARWVRRP